MKSSMKKAVVAGLFASSLAGCGATTGAGAKDPDPEPSPTPDTLGAVAATWSFDGIEAPTKVRIALFDATISGYTCTTLPFAPALGVVDSLADLPLHGSAEFPGLPEGARYLLQAVGERADGTRLASACHDQVNVLAGKTTVVDLVLGNWIADLNGSWEVAQNVNIGLPTQIQAALLGLQASCGLVGDESLCTLVTQVTGVLTDMQVVAEWTIDTKPDGSFTGDVRWISVQGVDVGTIDLVDGTFAGHVNGATGVAFDGFELTLQFGNLLLFVVEDVLGYDLGAYGPYGAAAVTALTGQFVSELSFAGSGTLSGVDDMGVAGAIDGALTGHVMASSWQHDFASDYVATRP